jgi:hypothetical protein
VAPTLKSQWLKYVPNDQMLAELPQANFDKLPLAQRQELAVFSWALIFAGRTPAITLANSAKPLDDISWAKLDADPAKYQGKVVPLKGWLKRLVRKQAPPLAASNFVDHYYEGWVYNGFNDTNPVFVTFTELPRDIEPSEQLDLYVQFEGYYFKKFRYLSDKGSRDGLFVVARTFRVLSQPATADATVAPPLTDDWLKYVKDDRELPKIALKEEEEITPQERFEIKAYTEAQLAVARTPAKAFAKSAKENDWVTFSHLFQEPSRFRGKVIPMKGKLVRIRKIEATIESEKQGVKFFYEGWVFTETKHSNPICVLFAHLPEGMQVSEKCDYEVRFNGYFFKRYMYFGGERKALRTLLFFAPTVERVKTPGLGEVGFSMTTAVLVGVLVLGGFTVMLIFGLNFWFRRGDAPVQARVALARQNLFNAEQPPEDSGLAADSKDHAEPEPDYPFENGSTAPEEPGADRRRFEL